MISITGIFSFQIYLSIAGELPGSDIWSGNPARIVFIINMCLLYQVDPSTGEADEEGYEDEYQLEELEVLN